MHDEYIQHLERELSQKMKLRRQFDGPMPELDKEIEYYQEEIWRAEREAEQIRNWGRLK